LEERRQTLLTPSVHPFLIPIVDAEDYGQHYDGDPICLGHPPTDSPGASRGRPWALGQPPLY